MIPSRVLRLGRRALLAVIGLAVVAIVGGNALILAASAWAGRTTSVQTLPTVPGISHLEAVDGRLWRGAAPDAEGYRALAAAGVTTVVDLRAEEGIGADSETVRSLGMRSVELPVRDGQVPSEAQVEEFLDIMAAGDGLVFVHCGAGVGRTSTMVGAWLVSDGQLNPAGALRRNLAIGPPSLEQLAFVAGFDGDDFDKPGAVVTAVSRLIDAPRRLLHVIGL